MSGKVSPITTSEVVPSDKKAKRVRSKTAAKTVAASQATLSAPHLPFAPSVPFPRYAQPSSTLPQRAKKIPDASQERDLPSLDFLRDSPPISDSSESQDDAPREFDFSPPRPSDQTAVPSLDFPQDLPLPGIVTSAPPQTQHTRSPQTTSSPPKLIQRDRARQSKPFSSAEQIPDASQERELPSLAFLRDSQPTGSFDFSPPRESEDTSPPPLVFHSDLPLAGVVKSTAFQAQPTDSSRPAPSIPQQQKQSRKPKEESPPSHPVRLHPQHAPPLVFPSHLPLSGVALDLPHPDLSPPSQLVVPRTAKQESDPKRGTSRLPPAIESPESPQLLQARHDDEDDEFGSDQELTAIFHRSSKHEQEPLDRPDAPPPGATVSLQDRRPNGRFDPIASFEIADEEDSSGSTTPTAGYLTPRESVPKGKTATQPAPQHSLRKQEDPSGDFELGTRSHNPQDAGHFYTTAPPVVLETYLPATQTAQPRVDSPRGRADSSTPTPQPAVTAGLAATAVRSKNPPPAPPGRNKFFNLPIRWEKKVYYLTIDAPPNMTREQVIAIVTARLAKISSANDPAFHPGMAALDLTFDTNTITAEAGAAKLVFDSTNEPEVLHYTSAMQAGKMDTLETLPEYTQTLERCRTESVRIREPGREELSSARVTESQPVRPTGPVRYIGFTNLGNTCYVNAALQSIAVNQRLRSYLLKPGALPNLPDNQENRGLYQRQGIQPNQDGTYPHPLKLILTEYEARLRSDHQYHGQPIHPGILIDYLRREGRISGRGLQGDAHEAFLALLLDANPNLEDSPIRAQETQTSVRAVPHLQSSDIHRMQPTRSQFPLIQLAAPEAVYPLQAHLSEHFTDSPKARGEASAPDKIHRGFAETPELLAVAVGRRNRNGTKNTTGITQPEQLALESGWARNSTDIRFEADCFIYHYGTQGKGGHYVTVVKEADPDHAGQFRYVELSDSAPPRVITDFQRKEETASMIFYHRAHASQAGSSQQGLKHAWSDPHSSATIEQVD